MYYRLECNINDESVLINIDSHQEFSFSLGEKFPADFKESVQFVVDQEDGGTNLQTILLPEPVFRMDFISHLRELGVKNIDDYAIAIKGLPNGISADNYRAVNIVGTVACMDFGKSEYENFDDMFFIDCLVIESAKAVGKLFFRLEEAHEYILIHESIARKIDMKRFPDIILSPVETI